MDRRENFLKLRLYKWRGKPCPVAVYILAMRCAGFSIDEVYDRLWDLADEEGVVFELQCSVADKVYSARLRRNEILNGHHTKAEWEAKVKQYNYRCFYCGLKMNRLSKDHIIPVAHGGTDTIDNIVPACMRCNQRKHTQALAEFKSGSTLKML